ncbi:phosphoglycerate dehydrogenase [Latilactobacillus curvatus]|uniref:phosphoglycerate dehydrogenase n=1 Tax=Latilactobacillus curvatus TaxID=28038 RepID=UPI000FECDA73|nr:phosphoglycerate dehydrogenase [Latilactobacillus curvatus]QAR35555.1 3-phosphoglycerate dehydrogenase [Latilactobacillus curvatus]
MTVILAAETIPEQHVKALIAQGLTIIALADLKPSQLGSIEIMFGWNKDVGPKILAEPGNQLKWIQTASSGVDYLPLATLAKQGVLVSNARGMHAKPIAQTALSYILYFTRGIYQSLPAQAAHQWEHHAIGEQMTNLEHRTLLIFGTGQIGEEIAKYAHVMGMHTIGVNRHGKPVANFDQILTDTDYEQALPQADFVINVMPLTPVTNRFFDTTFFTQLHRGAYFFNLGRGASVDEAALMHYLQSGHLAGAAIDVAQNEPLPSDSPLWATPNLIIMPHVSGYIADIHERLFKIFDQNLPSYLDKGELPVNPVDLSAGY